MLGGLSLTSQGFYPAGVSALIGSLWLREGALGPRLAGVAVILAGVACVALAR